LVRIYETAEEQLSQEIAECTNSQNPVKSRDIRSNDYIQKKLEKELLAQGYFYERKKGLYRDQSKAKRLDAEKIGQILMAFYNDMPGDAKNKKKTIFEDKFDDIFNDNLKAEDILLVYKLYEKIEKSKNKKYAKMFQMNDKQIEKENFILYASYYILYILKKLSIKNSITLNLSSFNNIWSLYSEALKLIKKFVKEEKKTGTSYYSHATFFKGNKLKNKIDDYFQK